MYFRRYVETALLPIVIDGKRLSDSYPAPKLGGAITLVGATVIILDRLGGLYRYDLATGSFEPLGTPPLPNDLEAYRVQRLASRINLADVYRLRLEGGRVLYSEPIWIGQRIRDLTQTNDGTIVLWTDDTQLLFIRVDSESTCIQTTHACHCQ